MVSFAISAEQQKWSDLNDLMLNDTVKDQASVGFEDIIIPRVGIELNFNDTIKLMAGAGFSYFHKGTGLSVYPWQIDLAYQLQVLNPTDHIISHQDSENNSSVELEGTVSTISLSFTTKF
ncbi:conserved protein of unknown function, might belong to Aromatic hydrocarbon degradation membrane protein [Moritella yayanosii]|uniref:Outer membrane protein beta-barrel domain-containing protein n=2 Tax=Moritella yayanosii TaxID=69539 RepID=A0A330LWQ7_9GAMM|nr:conserved protein of unknown function, might belong to Aromatic hydrocarbon degradation membrane protein [Moritella yayanosii]